MFGWFRRRASVRLKLATAFGVQSSLLVLAVGLSAGEYLRTSFIADGRSLDALRQALAEIGTIFPAVTVTAFAASFFLGRFARSAVAEPIEDAVARLEELACGNLDAPIPFADFDDETGRMARAMVGLRDSAAASARFQQELADQRRQNSILVDAISAIHVARRKERPPAPAPLHAEPRLVVDNMAPVPAAGDSDREDALIGLIALLGRTGRL